MIRTFSKAALRSVLCAKLSTTANIILERCAKNNGVVHLTLSRQDGKNSFSKNMLSEFVNVTQQLKDDKSIICLILKSNVAKVFCSGADLKERLVMPEEQVPQFVASLRSAFTNFAELPFPTIAAIEGVALGGGLELAMTCDLRIAGADATLGLTETALAIIPGAGGSQRLPRLVGEQTAKHMIFTAARLTGQQAQGVGLVNECVAAGQAGARAEEIACTMASMGPVALRMAKAAIDRGLQVDIGRGLEIERQCYAQVVTTADRREGLAAFVEKRKPKYVGN